MSGIFISYREGDAKPYALMLAGDLAAAFGKSEVFLDKDTLHAGNWRDQIHEALDRCKVVLVVIGRRWLTVENERGERRLFSPDDVHCEEIALALERQDVSVIPVLVDGAKVPPATELPENIRGLADQQAWELSDRAAQRAVDLNCLIEDIERLTGAARRPPSDAPRGKKSGILRIFLLGLLTSVALITLLTLALGWRLEPKDVGFLVLVVLVVIYLNSKFVSARQTGHTKTKDANG